MRNIASAGLLAALVALPACAFSAANQQPNPNGKLQTPDRAGTANVGAAATAPLHDLNITRQRIPPVLLAAITNPYDLPRPLNCGVITRQIRELDVALGVDLDVPGTPQAPSLKNGRIILALLHGAAEYLLPYGGFVRTLSGAQRHDQLVIEAIVAGSVRRGYLKGLGESRRCPRPATPVHFLKPPPPAREGRRGPLSQIH
jgi:hypothetical protein